MAAVIFDNVTKRYANVTALDAVSLSIPKDLVTVILGPSGGGKSTLLQTINGLVRPDKGEVRVLGGAVDYSRLEHLRRRIGYAVQDVGLFPHMRAWRNITLLAELEGWSVDRIESRGSELMSLVGLEAQHRSRYPHELSGGQQQRVGLCRAMMLNPPLFLLDEPFAAVDPVTRDEIRGELLKMQQREPRTVVIVTHDVREALTLGEFIVVLETGQIVQAGDRDTILEHPASEAVRKLFERYATN